MKKTKKISKFIGVILILPITYLVLSLVLTYIPVNKNNNLIETDHNIYLSTNGVHLEIIIPKNSLDTKILDGLKHDNQEKYFAFGWGDKNFYIETPTWADLTFINGFKALFINTSALLHITGYSKINNDWTEINVNTDQLKKLNTYINDTFRLDQNGKKILLPGLGYSKNDNFYEATGDYNCFNTCNSWINSALKQSDTKACLWTPYDFGLLSMHQTKKE